MGDESTDSAAARLRELNTYFRTHPVTGPVEGRSPNATASVPVSLAVVDHIRACVREVVDHTLAANPKAGPVPAEVEAVYAWCRENTRESDETVQLRREIIEYRQGLEHALRAGDDKVIPPHRCPECRTFGLRWVVDQQAALCTNPDCVDRDGFSHTFALARLAFEHVTARKNLRQARAT